MSEETLYISSQFRVRLGTTSELNSRYELNSRLGG